MDAPLFNVSAEGRDMTLKFFVKVAMEDTDLKFKDSKTYKVSRGVYDAIDDLLLAEGERV